MYHLSLALCLFSSTFSYNHWHQVPTMIIKIIIWYHVFTETTVYLSRGWGVTVKFAFPNRKGLIFLRQEQMSNCAAGKKLVTVQPWLREMETWKHGGDRRYWSCRSVQTQHLAAVSEKDVNVGTNIKCI